MEITDHQREAYKPGSLLTAREAIAYLRISLSTLHRMEQRGQIQSLRTPGGHRRYTLEMLNACLGVSGILDNPNSRQNN